MTARTARERVRAELTTEITEIARAQLATGGAAGLSLRAVAREMGMVSSAIYRYFPSRDDLLTTLIIDGYNALGAAVEQAEARCARSDFSGRWLAVSRAVREWALARPHEYALLYGSPVPGYRAPQGTIGPASRGIVVYGQVVSDAVAAGALAPVEHCPPLPKLLGEDTGRISAAAMPGVPDEVVARVTASWTSMFGMVSAELFGLFEGTIEHRDEFFDYSMTCIGRFVGLPA